MAAQTVNRYGRLCAEIYDLDKPVGSLFDGPYYQARLEGLDGPILEAGVGNGRLMVALLDAGLRISGFDASPDMLDRCRANAEGRGHAPQLFQARFQDFEAPGQAAILVPTSTFTLVDNFHEAMAVLERFRDQLAPGGLLLVDLPPLSFLDAPGGIRSWTAANGDLLTLESRQVRKDVVAQTRLNHDRYERWRDGRLLETELELFAYRAWGLEEFAMALARTGFADIEVCGNFRPGRPPRSGDGIFNFSARRPG